MTKKYKSNQTLLQETNNLSQAQEIGADIDRLNTVGYDFIAITHDDQTITGKFSNFICEYILEKADGIGGESHDGYQTFDAGLWKILSQGPIDITSGPSNVDNIQSLRIAKQPTNTQEEVADVLQQDTVVSGGQQPTTTDSPQITLPSAIDPNTLFGSKGLIISYKLNSKPEELKVRLPYGISTILKKHLGDNTINLGYLIDNFHIFDILKSNNMIDIITMAGPDDIKTKQTKLDQISLTNFKSCWVTT